MRNLLLFFGPVLNLVSIAPYIVDIIKGKTKPNIVSWVTWSILTGVGTAAIISQDGFKSSLLPLSATICTVSIVVLGFKYGFAKYTKFDIVCQASALIGLSLWALFNSPMIALIAVIAIDAVAALPTYLHTFRYPQEETWQSFALTALAAVITIITFNTFSVSKLAYPVYLLLADGGLAILTVLMRKKKGIGLSRKAIAGVLHENI